MLQDYSSGRDNQLMTNDWRHHIFGDYFDNIFNCCFGTCFAPCALATVKSHFDGSDCAFNCICFR